MNHDRSTLLALLVGLMLAVGILLGSHAIDRSHNAQTTAQGAQTQAQAAQAIAKAVRQEHLDSVRRFCEGQNQRHDATVSALDAIWSAAEKERPKRKAQVEASKRPTLLIINALAPKENCTAVVKNATQ